jgi:hypothetical protein
MMTTKPITPSEPVKELIEARFMGYWKKCVDGGIPLTDSFAIGVVKQHSREAFYAAYRLGARAARGKK